MTPSRALVLTAWSEQYSLAVRQLLEGLLHELDVPPATEGTTPLLSFLELAAEELLTNTFRYGYGDAPGRACLECCAATEHGRQGVFMRVTDEGPPFDPFTEAPVPDMDADCQDRTVGGLGVFLVKSLAARYHYERRGASNVVELFFPLPEQEHSGRSEPTAQAGDAPKRGHPATSGTLPGAVLGTVLLSALLCAALCMPRPALAEGVILHYEVVEEERPAEALQPIQTLRPVQRSIPARPTPPEQPAPARPDPAHPHAPQRAAAPSAPIPTEHLLDSMDVSTLSPHAALLALPRMVPPPLALALLEGRITAPAQWETLIAEAARVHGLPPALIAAVIKTESDFRPDTVSHKGAQGLMQLMPATQQYLGVADPFDPRANVLAGCDYLRQQWERFGNLDLALAAYNAGPQNIIKYGGIPPFTETQNFVRRVRSRMGDS